MIELGLSLKVNLLPADIVAAILFFFFFFFFFFCLCCCCCSPRRTGNRTGNIVDVDGGVALAYPR